jgi:DNA polymerase III subunit chi
MAEVWFYHLEQRPLSSVLPGLLERGLERGLCMTVRTAEPSRLEELSALLWTHEDVAFLPHGQFGEAKSDIQPIWITVEGDNPNNSTLRFYVDGAMPTEVAGLTRAIIMLDAADEEATIAARSVWKTMKADGHAISYWQQNENGRWENKAATGATS